MRKKIIVLCISISCAFFSFAAAMVSEGKVYPYYVWPQCDMPNPAYVLDASQPRFIKRDIIATARTVQIYYAFMNSSMNVGGIEYGHYKPYYNDKLQPFLPGDAQALFEAATIRKNGGGTKKSPQNYVYYVLDNQKGVVGSFDKCGEDVLDYFTSLEISADKGQIRLVVQAMVQTFEFEKLPEESSHIPTLEETCDYLYAGLKAREVTLVPTPAASSSDSDAADTSGGTAKGGSLFDQIKGGTKLKSTALLMNPPAQLLMEKDFTHHNRKHWQKYVDMILQALVRANPKINARKLIKSVALEVVTYREDMKGFMGAKPGSSVAEIDAANEKQRISVIRGVIEKLLELGGDGLAAEAEDKDEVAAAVASATALPGSSGKPAEEKLLIPEGVVTFEQALPYLVAVAKKALGEKPSNAVEIDFKNTLRGDVVHDVHLATPLTGRQKNEIVHIALGKAKLPEGAGKPGSGGAGASAIPGSAVGGASGASDSGSSSGIASAGKGSASDSGAGAGATSGGAAAGDLSKYEKLLALGASKQQVEQRMKMDNIDPAIIKAFFTARAGGATDSSSSVPASSGAALASAAQLISAAKELLINACQCGNQLLQNVNR